MVKDDANKQEIRPVLYDAKAVARLTALPLGTIYDLGRADALPFRTLRLGRSMRFNRREVDVYLGIQEPEPASPKLPRPARAR